MGDDEADEDEEEAMDGVREFDDEVSDIDGNHQEAVFE